MEILKISEMSGITYTGWGNDCGGFKPPAKGDHLDTQLFPGCKRKGKKCKNCSKRKVCQEYKEEVKPIIQTQAKTIMAKEEIINKSPKFNLKKFKGNL